MAGWAKLATIDDVAAELLAATDVRCGNVNVGFYLDLFSDTIHQLMPRLNWSRFDVRLLVLDLSQHENIHGTVNIVASADGAESGVHHHK